MLWKWCRSQLKFRIGIDNALMPGCWQDWRDKGRVATRWEEGLEGVPREISFRKGSGAMHCAFFQIAPIKLRLRKQNQVDCSR